MRLSLNGNHFRRARFARFVELLDELEIVGRPTKVLDIGGSAEYWESLRDLWQPRDLDVTIVNLFHDHDHGVDNPRYHLEIGNACALRFDDASFDVVHSNSVLEHVGPWAQVKEMAAEVERVAGRHYLQTPNFWFPIEPHFRTPLVQFLPEQTRAWLLQRRRLGYYAQASTLDEAMGSATDARLLTARQLRELFPSSRIEREKVAGLSKSLIVLG